MHTIVSILKKKKVSLRIANYLERIIFEEKLGNLIGYSLITFISLFFTLVIAKTGIMIAAVIIIALLGTPVVVASLLNIQFGMLSCIFVSYFIFHVNRVLGMYDLQTGVLIELFLVTSSLGLLLRRNKSTNAMKQFGNPISVGIFVYVAYFIFQAFNPNALNLSGWSFMIRGILSFVIMYVISMHAFNSLESVKLFTKFWLALAVLAALYGIYQEIFGFADFENRWIFSSEGRFKLVFIWGRFRRMSFLSDAATFGIFMAYCGIASFILATGPYSNKKKLLALISGIIIFVSMSFSGTRTAYAAVPVGLGLFMLMTANNKRTLIFSIALSLSLLFVIFGPFHSGPITRIRSTFSAEEDASYNVREENRRQIQPFLQEHPIGGGVASSGTMGLRFSPNHPLAGFPPDSGMLKTAMETGWIGLVIDYGLYFLVMVVGINNYFRSKNSVIKNLYLLYLGCFFAVTIANYAQVAVGQRPMNLLFYATFALVTKLKYLDDELPENTPA